MRRIFISSLILVGLTGAPAVAGSLEIEWSGSSLVSENGRLSPTDASAECTIGNDEPLAQYVTDFVENGVEFAYIIDPADFTCCADGLQPESITFYLNFSLEDIMYSGIQVAVYEAIGSAGAWTPGSEICSSPSGWFINADLPELYTIKVPPYPGPGDLVCPCLDRTMPYFIAGRLTGTFPVGAYPDAVRDGQPVGGRSFVRYGGGLWQDVVSGLGWAGELVLNSEIACCDGGPVPVEKSSWGQLKSLYR